MKIQISLFWCLTLTTSLSFGVMRPAGPHDPFRIGGAAADFWEDSPGFEKPSNHPPKGSKKTVDSDVLKGSTSESLLADADEFLTFITAYIDRIDVIQDPSVKKQLKVNFSDIFESAKKEANERQVRALILHRADIVLLYTHIGLALKSLEDSVVNDKPLNEVFSSDEKPGSVSQIQVLLNKAKEVQ